MAKPEALKLEMIYAIIMSKNPCRIKFPGYNIVTVKSIEKSENFIYLHIRESEKIYLIGYNSKFEILEEDEQCQKVQK